MFSMLEDINIKLVTSVIKGRLEMETKGMVWQCNLQSKGSGNV